MWWVERRGSNTGTAAFARDHKGSWGGGEAGGAGGGENKSKASEDYISYVKTFT